jgi:DnaJ-domain-containing protein 1
LTTDLFDVLQEPRRPWIDTAALKKKFLALSAETHPDRVHNASPARKEAAHQQYLEIHAAYNCLRDPKARLRHLLELERGAKPQEVDRVPPGLLELFMEISRSTREAEAFLAERAKVSSPLLQAQMFPQGWKYEQELAALARRVQSQQEALDQELRTLDEAWTGAAGIDRDKVLSRLEEMYRLFSYYSRWVTQLSERQFQLASKA